MRNARYRDLVQRDRGNLHPAWHGRSGVAANRTNGGVFRGRDSASPVACVSQEERIGPTSAAGRCGHAASGTGASAASCLRTKRAPEIAGPLVYLLTNRSKPWGVMELVDIADSKSAAERRTGSSPVSPTNIPISLCLRPCNRSSFKQNHNLGFLPEATKQTLA